MSALLSEVLRYQNADVVHQICHHQPQYSLKESQQLFVDLLAWLWFKNEREKQKKTTYLFGSLLVLDELWHLFILNTHDYVNFSQQYFGHYLHHRPEPIGFEHELSDDALQEYLDDCFNYLGQQWVERRFAQAFGEHE